MPADTIESLRGILRARGSLAGRAVFARERKAALTDIAAKTMFSRQFADLAGRSALIATQDHLLSALALIELDGVAKRIVICPPGLDPEHRRAIAKGADIDLIVHDGDVGAFAGYRAELVVPQPLAPTDADLSARRETEWVMLTSGTTGVPKMVSHTLRGLTGAIKRNAAVSSPPVWSTFYDIRRYGGLQIFLRAILGEGSMILSDSGEDTAAFLARLGSLGVTHISGTPSHWRRALMSPAASKMAPIYVRLSGEIADQAVLDNLAAFYTNASVGHAYASTEAGVGFEVTDGKEGFPKSLVDVKGGDVEMKVEDDTLRIRSRRTASGYIGPSCEALADADGFVDTGDIVLLRGDRYYYAGRRGGIINIGGLKVHPEEVEAVINSHASVRMSLVQSRRNPITGALVVADVVLTDDVSASAGSAEISADIRKFCSEKLERHKVPAMIRIVPSLDVTSAGKLARKNA